MARRGGVVAGVLTLGLLLLVWVSASRPVSIITGYGMLERPSYISPPTPTESAPTGPRSGREIAAGNEPSLDLSWIGDILTVLVLGALLAAIVLGARWVWSNRWHPPEQVPVEEFEVLPDVAHALVHDSAAQLRAVQSGSPRNGIVECWLRLESIIAEAGLPRMRAETSSEFTVRVLKRLDVDPVAISGLARLYREARFSEHPLDENARVAARSSLQRLQSDLAESIGGLQGSSG